MGDVLIKDMPETDQAQIQSKENWEKRAIAAGLTDAATQEEVLKAEKKKKKKK